ncbi:hypothetical protein DY000_02052004 [Brassica cretica]|uniref:Uncharacterized protein n=1 Tax=Brassica cretica TaxID=69181 RepID=A0ABQ7A7R0_BRACR|nr:hypothetical protein DY000_02052004 [Brassica cretica]
MESQRVGVGAIGERRGPSFRLPVNRCVGPADPSRGSEPGGSCLQTVGGEEGPMGISKSSRNLKKFFRLQKSRFQYRK